MIDAWAKGGSHAPSFSRHPCGRSRRRLLSHRPALTQPHVGGGSSLDQRRIGSAARSSIHTSTSARSQTTHRAVR